MLSTLRENARRAGRLHEALETGSRALALAEHSGDPTAAAFERANLAELRLLLGEPEPARALAEQAVTGAEPYDAWCFPYALTTLARVRAHLGETAEATALLDRAEKVAAAHGDRQAEHEGRTARAELALHARRPDGGAPRARRSPRRRTRPRRLGGTPVRQARGRPPPRPRRTHPGTAHGGASGRDRGTPRPRHLPLPAHPHDRGSPRARPRGITGPHPPLPSGNPPSDLGQTTAPATGRENHTSAATLTGQGPPCRRRGRCPAGPAASPSPRTVRRPPRTRARRGTAWGR
ncbi:hypothetical protein [Streptomyces sp. DfronAA-171]|uniref:hypothetical protein n=1 Tax=Streptomyces sp. DfronAA-171 TaxID=1839777 RepID=UPI000A710E4E|nr:hypothetical protein [Streptomyces sp. DfronAA-171]